MLLSEINLNTFDNIGVLESPLDTGDYGNFLELKYGVS